MAIFDNLINRFRGVKKVSETGVYVVYECPKCSAHLNARKNYGKLHVPCPCGKIYIVDTGKNIHTRPSATQKPSNKDSSTEKTPRHSTTPKDFPRYMIREKLEYLHSNLPVKPTAIDGLYSPPKKLIDEARNSGITQQILQSLSDHIGYFLGIVKPVRITLTMRSKEGSWIITENGKVKVSAVDSEYPFSGLYEVSGKDHSSITLVENPFYRLEQLLAILAHEYTHHYLYKHNVVIDNPDENEILTEVAAAYLGLGHLLIWGYKLSWQTDDTEYSQTLGYVTRDTIARAMLLSCKYRDFDLRELIPTVTECISVDERLIIRAELFLHRRKRKKEIETRSRRITGIHENVDEIKSCHSFLKENATILCSRIDPTTVKSEDGKALVNLMNAISTGILDQKVSEIDNFVSNMKNFDEVEVEVLKFKKEMSNWKILLIKHSK